MIARALIADSASDFQDDDNFGLFIDDGGVDESDEEQQHQLGVAALTMMPSGETAPTSPVPLWQHVNWSLTETDSSASSSSAALSLNLEEGFAAPNLGLSSPPRFAALSLNRARRRNLTHDEEVSDISDDDLSDARDVARKPGNSRRMRWTPVRGLIFLFVMTAYTIFGISEDDLVAELAIHDVMSVPEHVAAANMTIMTTASGPLLRSVQQQSKQHVLPPQGPQQNSHMLHYAVKQKQANNNNNRGLTFKQQEDLERFYHQPAMHSSPARVYYAAVLLGVVLWAVRIYGQAASGRPWKQTYIVSA